MSWLKNASCLTRVGDSLLWSVVPIGMKGCITDLTIFDKIIQGFATISLFKVAISYPYSFFTYCISISNKTYYLKHRSTPASMISSRQQIKFDNIDDI
jgi:hypothetical protein